MSVNVCGSESSKGSFRTPLRRKVRGWLLAGAQVGEGRGDPRFRLSYDRKPRGSTADWPGFSHSRQTDAWGGYLSPGICPQETTVADIPLVGVTVRHQERYLEDAGYGFVDLSNECEMKFLA